MEAPPPALTAPRRVAPRPSGPPLEARIATVAGARLAADGGPLDLAAHAGTIVATAATTLREVLTPRGPEPVLGGP